MSLPFSLLSNDVGKKIYKIKQTYVLTIEQYVKADDKDEAFNISLDKGGINYDRIDRFLTNEESVCETNYVDVEPEDTNIEYQGLIIEEEGDVKFDNYEPEFKNNTTRS